MRYLALLLLASLGHATTFVQPPPVVSTPTYFSQATQAVVVITRCTNAAGGFMDCALSGGGGGGADYGPSTAALSGSTVSLAGLITDLEASTASIANRVAIDTTTLGVNLALTSASTQTIVNRVAVATTTLGVNLALTSGATQTLATKVAVDTTALAAADAAVFLQVAADTTTIGTRLASVALSTTSLASGSATTYVLTKGSTMTGALSLGSHLINLVTDPVSAQDAATKNYVDSNLSGLEFRAPIRLVTTAALPANSYSNGAGTITGLSIGVLTIDGTAAQVGDRVLINNESASSHNGIYTVTTNSSLVVFVLTRATDFDVAAEMADGVAVFVDSGVANTATGWVTTSSVTVVGTDPVLFVQFSGLGDVTAGSGLTKSGNTMSVDSSSVAVLSGGFVLNSQLDPSSVTKQGFVTLANLTGIVPTGKIDLSTVTTRFNQVAVDTTTLFGQLNSTGSALSLLITQVAADTTTIGTRLTSVALSTTNLAAGSATTYLAVAGGTEVGQITSLSTITILGTGFSVGASSFSISGGSATIAYRIQAGSVLNQGLSVVQGTETVQGAAFSVGGATFTISGGSATFGIPVAFPLGVFSGISMTTLTPAGFAVGLTSSTVGVAGSTTTQGTALTAFSTDTAGAYFLSTPGDSIDYTCAFTQTVAPGTPLYGAYIGSTVIATANDTTANTLHVINCTGTLVAVNPGRMIWLCSGFKETSATSGNDAPNATIGIGQIAFDNTVAQTFHCQASRATGGNINFGFSKLNKASR